MSVMRILGVGALIVLPVIAAHAKSRDEVIDEVTVIVATQIHTGDAPARVAAFLRSHKFQAGKYNRDFHMMTGVAAFDRGGAHVEGAARAAYKISINFDFGDHDHLKDYYVEGARAARGSARSASEEYDGPSRHYTAEFASPDGSCRILYKGHSDHGHGSFFDVSGGNKRQILKEYFRVGPDVRWISDSMAELFFSEGFPAYHSYYYDCLIRRTSPPYFQSVAFEPKGKLVATLEEGAIVFYKSFGNKPFYRARVSNLDMFDFFNCDSEARFTRGSTLHLKAQCKGKKGIDTDIQLPG